MKMSDLLQRYNERVRTHVMIFMYWFKFLICSASNEKSNVRWIAQNNKNEVLLKIMVFTLSSNDRVEFVDRCCYTVDFLHFKNTTKQIGMEFIRATIKTIKTMKKKEGKIFFRFRARKGLKPNTKR